MTLYWAEPKGGDDSKCLVGWNWAESMWPLVALESVKAL